ncbi:MAG TPA: PP2C family protein-serine/threonine phosphatase [Vicinamibacterales bacterium]
MPATEVAELAIGSVICAIGALAIAAAAVRRPRGEPAVLWFGIFTLLYGVRLLTDSQLVRDLARPEAAFWDYVDAAITYGILAPALRFAVSLVSGPRRPAIERVIIALWGYAAVAFAVDLLRGRPGTMLWLNPFAVAVFATSLGAQFMSWARTAPWPREVRVAVAGGIVFTAFALYSTFGGGWFAGRWDPEPFGLLVFICALGNLVAQRSFETERRLVAVSRELELAREIQQSLLPHALPDRPGLRIAARYLPMQEVAGDFYDAVADDRGVGILVADVSGHGVPAALVASMLKVAFASEAERAGDPGAVLQGINRTMTGLFDRAFVTACYGFFTENGRRLSYAAAGHPPLIVRRRRAGIERLEERGIMLAVMPAADYETRTVDLEPGDLVVFYTDGLLEAADATDAFFGDARLDAVLTSTGAVPADVMADQLVAEVRRWSAGPLRDDVTVVVVEVGG